MRGLSRAAADAAADHSISLRETDTDAELDLQVLIAQTYGNGAHDDIDYAAPLDVALSPEDEQWADVLVKPAGKRG